MCLFAFSRLAINASLVFPLNTNKDGRTVSLTRPVDDGELDTTTCAFVPLMPKALVAPYRL